MPGPFEPAGLLVAGQARREIVRGDLADHLAAAGQAHRLAVEAALTALRTLMSSNGLIFVFIAIQRPPPLGVKTS